MSLLLATGVGAGFGYTVDNKRDYDELSNIYDQLIDYLRRIDPYDEIVKPVIFDKIDNAADKIFKKGLGQLKSPTEGALN
ncbi:hypothetical protein QJS10_CPB12g01615 [Acorus calamus]|uniref:Uncharacterized protein n=1 Tax=Acorus calamus TaxID=4465 RepID=A0AAV9DLK0_ACOCL|nr:hypothetical protein QJS10_CPB12g01615 [Acorus calamus]